MAGFLNAITGSVGTAPAVGDYESIATVSVGSGGRDNIEFLSIPSTYKHLQIRGIGKDNRNYTFDNINVRFNGNATTGAYTSHLINGDGGNNAVADASNYVQNIASAGLVNAFSDTAAHPSTFGVFIIDILDYANTERLKTVRVIGGVDDNNNNTLGIVSMSSGLWNSTAAITSILIKGQNGGTLQEYSHFALYGIRG
jgi:hypothetical protein